MNDNVQKHIKNIEELAKNEGLDFFPVIFELVNRDIMLEACSYGLPVRSRHWSYARSYMHQKIFGELGLSKVYEIVFNNDPAYAFMMDTNSDVINIMVAAHVLGHSHFFKNNVMFQGSDRNMIHRAAERASRVDQYIEQYGLEKVEHLMDIGFSLDRHIDWRKGLFRKKYPKKNIREHKIEFGEFEDLLNIGDHSRRSIKRVTIGDHLPPHPERDLLWFLINYAPLDEWEKDILGIIREESYYFYPIVATKVINEGLAVFVHSELMQKYDKISDDEFIEFAKCHSSVVNPGNQFNINPYYLGFKVFTDIQKRWDKLYQNGESPINGTKKVIQVAAEEDDISFLRNYLTTELAMELGLFSYGYKIQRDPDMKDKDLTYEHGLVEIKDRELDKIIEYITRSSINYGVPLISITETDGDTLIMHHEDSLGPLDKKYTEKTMEYIYELWGAGVELKTYNYDKKQITYYYDESGFSIIE